ncbi:MAG: DUF6702 family protein, partial [Ginsengibacter sp.]
MEGFFHHITFLFSFIMFFFQGENRKYNHPIYVSVVEITYNNGDKFASVICKTFSDDFKLALQNQSHKTENFDSPENIKNLSSEMEGYIKKHLQLKINGKLVDFVFTNYKKDGNTIWSYFTTNAVSDINKFEVTDTIFYELYDNQIQLVYIT